MEEFHEEFIPAGDRTRAWRMSESEMMPFILEFSSTTTNLCTCTTTSHVKKAIKKFYKTNPVCDINIKLPLSWTSLICMTPSFQTCKLHWNPKWQPRDILLAVNIHRHLCEDWQPIRTWYSPLVCTSALTILSTMVSRVSCRLHFITPSKYCERCFSASVTLVSRLLYVFSAARFCAQAQG